MPFVQIIEITTTKVAEIEELMNGSMAATQGRRSASRSTLAEDRERPDTYVQVVEFPSYEEAMANSALPETTAFAEKLSALCLSGPTFRNLDLVRSCSQLSPPEPARIPGGAERPFGRATSSHIAGAPGMPVGWRGG